MSSQISSLAFDYQEPIPNCNHMSPLLNHVSGSKDSLTALKIPSTSVGLPEGPSAFSIRFGSEQSPESYTYCDIPDLTIDRPGIPSGHATGLKNRYQSDSKPVKSGPVPVKNRPVPRPPPRSASESDADPGQRTPARTYLNNSACSPLSGNYRNAIVPDRTNEIRKSTKGPQISYNRQRLCVIVAFVAIFLALSLAAAAAIFSIHNYLTRRDYKQIQENIVQNIFGILQNETLASAHVGLMVKNPTAKEIYGKSNYTMHLTDDKARLYHEHVKLWDRGLTIQQKGMYYVYSSIGFNINENATNCDKLPHKTWIHHVMLARGNKDIGLLRSEHTCCTGCPEYHSSGFTGGVFQLKPGDNIFVRVSAPVLVFDDKESSFLGLFLIK